MSTDPTEPAPHVEASWQDAFVLELRLRDVPGTAIGDALAEVESHVVDAGTTALEAFGDPTRYAEQLAVSAAAPVSDDPRDMVGTALGGAALVAVVEGVVGWWRDGTVVVTGSSVALVVVMLAAPFVLQRYGRPLLRTLATASFRRTWLLSGLVTVGVVGLGLLTRGLHLGTLPAPAVTGAALALLLLATVVEVRTRSLADPLVAPGTDPAAVLALARRDARRAGAVITAVRVGVVVLAVGAALLVTRWGG